MRVQVREVGQRVKRFELVPRVQPAWQLVRDLGLDQLEPVRKIKTPRHEQVGQEPQNRVGAQSERRGQTSQSSHFCRRAFTLDYKRCTDLRQARRVLTLARLQVSKHQLEMSQRLFE